MNGMTLAMSTNFCLPSAQRIQLSIRVVCTRITALIVNLNFSELVHPTDALIILVVPCFGGLGIPETLLP
jgi:hypothetical protein